MCGLRVLELGPCDEIATLMDVIASVLKVATYRPSEPGVGVSAGRFLVTLKLIGVDAIHSVPLIRVVLASVGRLDRVPRQP